MQKHRLASRLSAWTATLLLSASLTGPTQESPDETDGKKTTIEGLEALAERKLRAASAAVADKIELNVNALTGAAQAAGKAREQLVTYAGFVMSDGRTVGAHLVDRMLATENGRLRRELSRVLVGAAGTLRGDKDVDAKLLAAAKEADRRYGSAIAILVATRSRTACETLAPLVTHADPEVRAATLRLLGHLGDDKHAATVVGALQTGDQDVRLAAIEAIRRRGFRDGIAPLATLVDDAELPVAQAAIEALAKLEAREAAPALLGALLSTSDATRSRLLVNALGDVGPARSVTDQGRIEKALKSKLSGRNRALAREAGFALAKLGSTGNDVERALTKDLKAEVARDAKNIFARLELARTYKQLGDCSGNRTFYKRAIRDYKAILRDDRRRKSRQTMTYIAIAGCHARLGQFAKADSYLSKADGDVKPLVRTNPDFAEMRKESRFSHWFQ